MPRKKLAKTKAKKTSTRSPKNKVLTLADSIEKDFRDVPVRLAALYKKDLIQLRLNEKKIKANFKKAQIRHSIAEEKFQRLTAKNVNKKQLLAASKVFKSTNQHLATIAEELKNLNQLAELYIHKQHKYLTIGKELLKLEKQLDSEHRHKSSAKKSKKKTIKDKMPKELIASVTDDMQNNIADANRQSTSDVATAIETTE